MRRSPWLPVIEAAAIGVFAALMTTLATRLISAVGWPELLAAAVIGFAAADLMSGLVHWFCDTFFEEDTPGIGSWLIAPFREHHRDPLALTRHGFLELTGNSCIALAPVLSFAWWLGSVSPLADAALVSFSLALVATNIFHRWAHSSSVSPGVRWLQNHGLILTPSRHAVHHQPGSRSSYCVTTGWINHLVDRTRAFDALGRLLEAIGIPRTRELSGR